MALTDENGSNGFVMPVSPLYGGGNNGGGFGWGGDWAWILLLLLIGGGGWGMGGFGGGAGMLGATSLAATETAALINQQNTADRVAAANAKADAIAGIVTANGTKIETVKDALTSGFFANQTNLCELGNNIAQQFNAQTMQGMNMHNATTALLNDMRAENAKCCCENKYQAAADKCEIIQSMNANTAAIMARIDCLEKTAMQDKLNAANERNAELKARIDNQNQTNTLLAAIQASQRGYAPCGTSCCQPNLCDQLSAAIIAKGIDGIVNPTTAAAA